VRAGQRGWYVSLPSALRSLRDASASLSLRATYNGEQLKVRTLVHRHPRDRPAP